MKPKIAIYSGVVPSTTFIERLILGVSEKGYKIYLFGSQNQKVTYTNKNIFIKTYSDNRFHKLFVLLKYSLLLFLFKNSEKKILDNFISRNSKNKILLKLKYYPVLWYKPDIFHIQWAKGIYDWMWVQKFGIKIIVSLRGTHINHTPITEPNIADLYRLHFPHIKGFHAVSRAIAREAQKYGAEPDKIKVVYSGLPKNNSSPELKPKNQTFKILSVGRNHWVKGYNYALDCMKILSERGIDFEYTIIGAKGVEELEFQKTDLELDNFVIFKSNVAFIEVQQMMLNADLVLLPSVEEGIANVVLEAMQLGTMVLTTDCGGMNEVIENEKNGFIVPVRNPEKMAEAIIKIMSLSEVEKQDIIKEARLTIQQNHTEDKMVAGMISLYETILEQ